MADLRNKLIRLAHQNPELREHLLPLVKVALTIGGRKILEKLRTERIIWPIDDERNPFQLSSHELFKSQLRYYLPFLSKNLLLGDTTGWKIQPSSIHVEYFIDKRGLVLRLNYPSPSHRLKAKNTQSKTYWLENDSESKYVAPSLKRTLYGYRQADEKWYPIIVPRLGVFEYSEGPFKGERHFPSMRLRFSTEAKFQELTNEGNFVWIPKGRVTLFLLDPDPNEYVVSSLVNVGKSKTIQTYFLGADANQVQRMTKAELRTLISEKFDSFSGLKRTRRNLWDFKSFDLGAIHIIDESSRDRDETLQYNNTVGLFVQTEKSEEYDLRAEFDEEEEGMRWDETDAYYQFHAELDELHSYVERMLKALFPNREIREGYSDGDDFRHFIFEISV